MGARTNYTIVSTSNPAQNINVYSHWDGGDSVAILQGAIAKAMPRLEMGDDFYAVRIIINALQGEHEEETGYGIYIGEEIITEEQYDYKEINLMNRTVTVGQMTMSLEQFARVMV